MAKIVAILGQSGDGKTTSTVINPDGSFDLENYQGMDPKSHFIMNLDRKDLPIQAGIWELEKGNYAEPTSFAEIRDILKWVAEQPHIKSISIDTINIYLAMKEFNDRKKMTFDLLNNVA